MKSMKSAFGVVLVSVGSIAACSGVSAIGSGDEPGAGGGASGTRGTELSGGGSSGTQGAGLAGGAGTASGGARSKPSGGVAGGGTPPEETGGTPGGGSDGGGPPSGNFKILVLDYTLDFHHDSIEICDLMLGLEDKRAGVEKDRGKTEPPNLGVTPDAMMPPGTKPNSQWTAELATPDMAQFTDANLKQYAMVFSCNPTGTVFSGNPLVKDKAVAMAALQKFVEGGGAWAGVHSASDFEKTNGFPWVTNLLIGGYFDHHDSDGTSGTVKITQEFANHPVMKGMQTTWNTQDEWYYMNRDVSAQPGFQILQRLASDNRAVTWVKEFGNGRAFYTIRGHNKSVFEEADFRKLVLNGILWATHRLN